MSKTESDRLTNHKLTQSKKFKSQLTDSLTRNYFLAKEYFSFASSIIDTMSIRSGPTMSMSIKSAPTFGSAIHGNGFRIAEAASWLGLDAFFDAMENQQSKDTDDTSSQTSYTTESSEGFAIDDNYVVVAQSSTLDDMSDIMESVVDDCTSTYASTYSGWSQSHYTKRLKTSGGSTSSESNTPKTKSMDSILEEDEEDENQYEAYLRAKMFSLWSHIQLDLAKRDDYDLSEKPSTEEDGELLAAYAATTKEITC